MSSDPLAPTEDRGAGGACDEDEVFVPEGAGYLEVAIAAYVAVMVWLLTKAT